MRLERKLSLQRHYERRQTQEFHSEWRQSSQIHCLEGIWREGRAFNLYLAADSVACSTVWTGWWRRSHLEGHRDFGVSPSCSVSHAMVALAISSLRRLSTRWWEIATRRCTNLPSPYAQRAARAHFRRARVDPCRQHLYRTMASVIV